MSVPSTDRSMSNRDARYRTFDDNELDAYFKCLDKESLLSAEEELRLATQIVELRRDYWTRVFEYTPLVIAIATVIESARPSRKQWDVDTKALIEATTLLAQKPSAKRREAQQRCIEPVVEAMCRLDSSCELLDAIVVDIEALADGRQPTRLEAKRPRRSSKPFQAFVRRLQWCRIALHQARQTFARGHLRLVVMIAQRYRHTGRMPLADLLQEGNAGLMIAVDRFDPARGFRFSTYGSWWIRHAISRALSDTGRTVRLPVHVVELRSKIRQARAAFEHEHHRMPEADELAARLHVDVDKIERFGRVLVEQDTPVNLGDEDTERTGIEAIQDEAPIQEDSLHSVRIDASLEEALDVLRPMEFDILRMRFGLDDQTPKTLREIGEVYSLSRERIRQIQARALGKLRDELGTNGLTKEAV